MNGFNLAYTLVLPVLQPRLIPRYTESAVLFFHAGSLVIGMESGRLEYCDFIPNRKITARAH